jgi:omega-hydroxy-beta-dihydromenaquinone-9 sulfotransferase
LSEGLRLVLKSPPHLGRVGTLLEMFPGAQFVHIVRDPYAVYASTHKLWRDSFAYVHLQKPSSELVDELILSWYTELFSLFERDRPLVPSGSLYEVKYEDLEAHPIETLRALYEAFGLSGFGDFEKRACAYLDSLKDYQKNVHSVTDADREKVQDRWRRTFDQYGYSV